MSSVAHHRVAHVRPHHSHHRHLLDAIGHRIGQAARGVGHAAQHVGSLIHHHTAASVSVLVVVGVVAVAALSRVLARGAALRAAQRMADVGHPAAAAASDRARPTPPPLGGP